MPRTRRCSSARSSWPRKVRRRQAAPVKAVEAIEAAATLPFADGCRRERELFFECVRGEQAKALIHVFFAERAAAKVPGACRRDAGSDHARRHHRRRHDGRRDCDGLRERRPRRSRSPTRRRRRSTRAWPTIRRNYDIVGRSAAASRARPWTSASARITPQRGLRRRRRRRSRDRSRVRESRAEEARVSRARRGREAAMPCWRPTRPRSTSTTSRRATSRPESVVGLHFFSPAHVMRLVEIVRGAATSATTICDRAGARQASGQGSASSSATAAGSSATA